MLNRRDAVRRLGLASLCPWRNTVSAADDAQVPPLASGTPTSPERIALIEALRKRFGELDGKFEARTHSSDAVMPYRLFRPISSAKTPLVLYLHGSGGLDDDNLKQITGGNAYGTRVWALPENQKRFPCYVAAPQTQRGWNNYVGSREQAEVLPGLGEGSRLALEIVEHLCKEFPIDERRIYVTGQSMGGSGVWNVITHRPRLFAAAVICCASASHEDGTASIEMPVWNFHGDSDQGVPVSVSRERMAARRKAGGHPLYTEYAGVDHNVWQWAYTEPEMLNWVFLQRRD